MDEILVIGAGAAGLYAASLLSQKHNVTVLDAAPFAGGRIRTIREGEMILEAGAEFIHGSQQITMQHAAEAGLHCHPYPETIFRNDGNGPEPAEIIEDFPTILKMMTESEDITLNDFLARMNLPENNASQLLLLSKSFSLAAPGSVSVRYLSKDWESLEDEQFFLEEGYHSIIDHLLRKCGDRKVNILYNTRVEKIDWSQGNARIFTTEGIYQAVKVIITVPVNRINTRPGIQVEISDEVQNALNCFGYGPTIKTIVEVKEPFWAEEGFFLPGEKFATWWTHPKYRNRLTGWMDEESAQKASTDVHSLFTTAVDSLAGVFCLEPAYIKKQIARYRLFNWQSGAYSFGKPGFAEARKVLAEPLQETIYFAGEAFQDKVTGATVEAAFVSAEHVAGLIL